MNASFYNEIKKILISARNKVYQTANFAMVEAYWNIGKSIIEEQGGNEKAEYGTGLLKELSKQMTQDFGKGFTVALTVKVVVSKIYIFCSCRSSDIVLYLT